MRNILTVLLYSSLLAVAFVSCDKKTHTTAPKEEPQKAARVTDTTMINGVLLELIDNNGKAELKVHSDKYVLTGQLKITPPCYFLRWSGKVKSFAYPKIGIQHTLGILGNILSNEEKKRIGEKADEICGEKVQGLLVKKDSMMFTNKLMLGLSWRDYAPDEKDFWDFAHRGFE